MKCDRCRYENEISARYCSSCGGELAINLVGEVLGGRYRILSFIGSGGMGRVYRGEHTLLERPVAIKVLAPEYARDQTMWDRFRREALAAGRIAHPNIAATLDFGYEDRLVYSVMEFVDGTPLDLLKMPLPVPRSLEICRQIANALGAAHDAGVIHRDVKPGNIIVCELGGQDFIKVVDFGLAVLRTRQWQARNTGPGFTMGTPAYVSPEQVLGERIDARADIYSLGAMFYEMLVGQPPFGYGDPAKLSVSHAYKIPSRPSEYSHVIDVPEEVEDFAMRMLAKHPDERPGDGRTVASRMAHLLGQVSSAVPAVLVVACSVVVMRFENIEDIDEAQQRDIFDTVRAMGGKMARSVGDDLIAYFDSPTAAVAAAARLAAETGVPPAVAVHHGEVELGSSGGVFGDTVNTALRVAKLAAPGEAIATEPLRDVLDSNLQACLTEGGRLHLRDQARSGQVYRVTGFTSDETTTHPPVVIGEVREKSTVAFTCSCDYQGVIIAGRLHTDKAIRIRCAGCGRQISVVPIFAGRFRPADSLAEQTDPDGEPQSGEYRPVRASPAPRQGENNFEERSTGRVPRLRDQLIVDPPPDSAELKELSQRLKQSSDGEVS